MTEKTGVAIFRFLTNHVRTTLSATREKRASYEEMIQRDPNTYEQHGKDLSLASLCKVFTVCRIRTIPWRGLRLRLVAHDFPLI